MLASFICLLSFSFLCLQFQFSFPAVVALHFVFFIWGFAFISFLLKYFKFSCFLGFIFVLHYCCRAFYLEFSHFGFFFCRFLYDHMSFSFMHAPYCFFLVIWDIVWWSVCLVAFACFWVVLLICCSQRSIFLVVCGFPSYEVIHEGASMRQVC